MTVLSPASVPQEFILRPYEYLGNSRYLVFDLDVNLTDVANLEGTINKLTVGTSIMKIF